MDVRRLGVVSGVLAAVSAWGSVVYACTPRSTSWVVRSTFPTEGAEGTPLNGGVVVNLDFYPSSFDPPDPALPDAETFEQTFNGQVLLDGVEEVPGRWVYEPSLRRTRFVADQDFEPDTRYEVTVELYNTFFDPLFEEDRVETFSFTTGAERVDDAPSFDGLQGLSLTEHEVSVRECCDPPPEQCGEDCGPYTACEWCWTVGWRYPRSADLTFQPVQDELVQEAVSYVIYRLDAADGAWGEPLRVTQGAYRAEAQLTFVLEDEDEGPFCFGVRAVDAWGRWDDNDIVRCVTEDDLIAARRSPVPRPDRSGCLDEGGDDAGGDDGGDDVSGGDSGQDDVGGDNNGNNDNNGSDVGVDVGLDSADEGSTPNVVSGAGTNDEGCLCATPARRIGLGPWLALGLALAGLGVARGRRRS